MRAAALQQSLAGAAALNPFAGPWLLPPSADALSIFSGPLLPSAGAYGHALPFSGTRPPASGVYGSIPAAILPEGPPPLLPAPVAQALVQGLAALPTAGPEPAALP